MVLHFIWKRTVYMVVTMLIIVTATFFLMKVMPGSPLSNEQKLTEEQRAIILQKYGLDEPLYIQYVTYIGNLLHGDLGVSFQYDNRSVSDMIWSRIGPSAQLGLQAMILGTFLGIILGGISALHHNTLIDLGATTLAVLGKSIPNFVVAGILQYYIGVKLQLLPVAQWNSFLYTIMPTIALSLFPLAVTARFTRSELLEVLQQDFIMTAKAKGLSSVEVIVKHGLRNALIPLITLLGPLTVSLMTGTLVIEKIFAVPGLGEQFVRSVMTNDYPVIMGTTLLFAFLFIFILFIVDILYGFIDPRIRFVAGKGNR